MYEMNKLNHSGTNFAVSKWALRRAEP